MEAIGVHEPRTGSSQGRWPAGFFGMLVLLIAVESVLARVEPELEPLSASDKRHDRTEAARSAIGAEVLCFGDSLVKTGVIPAALEARLDRSAYNLAVLGAPVPASYFLFKRALDSGARPEAVVLDTTHAALMLPYRPVVRDWSVLIGPADALCLARDSRDLGFFAVHMLHHFVPSVRLRIDLRISVADALASRTTTLWGAVTRRQFEVNRGAIILGPTHPKDGPDPSPDGSVSIGDRLLCYSEGFYPLPPNLTYLDRFFLLAGSRHVPVFFVLPPIHPGVQAERDRLGVENPYLTLIRKLVVRHPGMIVVDGRHAGYPHGMFADSHHMNSEGATAYTEALADVIAERLNGTAASDRWLQLPPYRDATARLAIENMDESREALSRRPARF